MTTTPMPLTQEAPTRVWCRAGLLAEHTPAERQVILACTRPSHRSFDTRSLWKHSFLLDVATASLKIRIRKQERIQALVDAAYEVSRMRDWEERRIQAAIRRGILSPFHDGCEIDETLRPIVEPSEELRWCRRPLGPHAALAFSDAVPSLRDRADDQRRLLAEAAVKRGILPTDRVEIKFVSGGSYGVEKSEAQHHPWGMRNICRQVTLDRRLWDEVVTLGLDECSNGLVLAVRGTVVDDPCGRLVDVEAAQRGHRLIAVKAKRTYAVAAYDGHVWLYADQSAAKAELDVIAARYWRAQDAKDAEEAVSAEDAAAFADLMPGVE